MITPLIDVDNHGDELDNSIRVVMFGAGVRRVDALPWVLEHMDPMGTQLPPSRYDCTGKWWLDPVRVSKVHGHPTFTQCAHCDI